MKMDCPNFMLCHSLCYQYVTLFASAFPLAAAVSIVFLFIEGRADLFKLLYVYQRPRVRRYDILGIVKLRTKLTFNQLMQFICYFWIQNFQSVGGPN